MQAQQFLQQARQKLSDINRNLSTLDQEKNQYSQQIESLQAQAGTELGVLASLYLPTLEPAVVARVKPLTGYGFFANRDLLRDQAEDRAKLEREKAQIEASPDFQNRDGLLHPITGDLTVRLRETEEQYNILKGQTEPYEAEPRLLELLANGYGTPAYPHRWWHAQYYSDWKWGDIYLERFFKPDFETLRTDYEKAKQDRDTLAEALREVKGRYLALTQMEERHVVLTQHLAFHEARFLQACQGKLREHLAHVDREQLFAWSEGDRALEAKIKTVHGIEKKSEYLAELVNRQHQEDKRALQEAANKLQGKINKFMRPKNYHATIHPQNATAWLGDGGSRILARRAKFKRNYSTVLVFDDYHRYDYARDLLWWDLMTDGRIDGNFIPEVNQWHRTHGAYDRSAFADAGASTSAVEPDDASFADPS